MPFGTNDSLVPASSVDRTVLLIDNLPHGLPGEKSSHPVRAVCLLLEVALVSVVQLVDVDQAQVVAAEGGLNLDYRLHGGTAFFL